MNLGTRCGYMLTNGCQCPNTAMQAHEFCLLHLEIQRQAEVAAEQAKIETIENS